MKEKQSRLLNVRKLRVIGRARRLCAELGHTLYLDRLDSQGRMVYRIKEVPSFTLSLEPLL